ncbi:DUF2924 domain-containing protein [Ferrovibrio sp.]|uniref:DUF2924 domain-containing protein n=1 Tax=Ferrovibrio sp. TaxID=1917215 RepID=UPI0025BDF3C5|nr:DUF2924 domain-containing protein [Ferrovibrio sp.]MBX3455574.1 DUF2924 domain-containing protein [Ferrovibrio sp.]
MLGSAQGQKGRISAEIKKLEEFPTARLKQRWRRKWPVQLPKQVSRELLVISLAWELQASEFGGLPRELQRQIDTFASDLKRSGKIDGNAPIRIKPGTRLVREWQGERHEVTVLEKRFAYKNKQFDSLSEIAREITGTRWSGPVFFGLKKVSRPRATVDA